MSRVKTSLDHKEIRRLIWLVLTVFVLLGYSVQSVAGSAYYSLFMESNATVSSPPVILHEGTAGNCTIYANSTSAKVSVEPSGDFNYILNMTENHDSNWQVRLSAYDESNTGRLSNCSIYIYDGSNSTQIVILNGTYGPKTGPWYDLNASETERIWMHVETSNGGTSYVYTYLEIKVPNTKIYARYIITFEIT